MGKATGSRLSKKPNRDGSMPAPFKRTSKAEKQAQKRTQLLDRIVRSSTAAKKSATSIQKKKAATRRQTSKTPGATLHDLTASFMDSLKDVERSTAARSAHSTARAQRRVAQQSRRGSSVKSVKQRKYLTAESTARAVEVTAHPAFNANPLAAVMAHLEATLPAAPPVPKTADERAMDKARRRAKPKTAKQRQQRDLQQAIQGLGV